MRNIVPAVIFAALALSACGGGGSLTPQSVAVANPAPKVNGDSPATLDANPGSLPSPSVTNGPASVVPSIPTITVSYASAPSQPSAATSETVAQSYLPFHVGNTWTLGSGQISVIITDAASGIAQCACAINNSPVERFDVIDNSENGSYSLYYAKGNWPFADIFANHRITYYIGMGNMDSLHADFYSNDASMPGIPQIDDSGITGETFTLTSAFGIVTTPNDSPIVSGIISIGGSQNIGSQVIQNVANTQINIYGGGGQAGTGFAPGIGFASITTGNSGRLNVTSYSVDKNSTI